MNATAEQIAILRKVVLALGSLRDELVLVGGMATGLLVTDPGADEPRQTVDVDLIVEIASRDSYYEKLCKRLRARGFREDTRERAPLCRWLLDGQVVDVMPTDARVLGFSNPWYSHAIRTSKETELPSSGGEPVAIRLITAAAFCATKLASFASRGGGDLLHFDIEDIVSLVDGRAELVQEIEAEAQDLRNFVAASIGALLRAGLEEQIASHLPGDSASQARQPRVGATLRRIADLKAPCR